MGVASVFGLNCPRKCHSWFLSNSALSLMGPPHKTSCCVVLCWDPSHVLTGSCFDLVYGVVMSCDVVCVCFVVVVPCCFVLLSKGCDVLCYVCCVTS